MADMSYGSIGRDILFHILRYSAKEIRRLWNRALCNVEGTHHLIWQTSHLIWQQRLLAKIPAQCYVNGVVEIFYKYLQSARRKYWLADGSALSGWHLKVRQSWNKILRILPFASLVYCFHWIIPKLLRKKNSFNPFYPRPGRGGGGFALPSCFSQISNKLFAWFLRAFQNLTRNERRIFWKRNRKSVDNFLN